mgnify:CR=1 FL=1
MVSSVAATLLVQRALGSADEPTKHGGVYKIRRFLDTSRSSLASSTNHAVRSAAQLSDDLQALQIKSARLDFLHSPRAGAPPDVEALPP